MSNECYTQGLTFILMPIRKPIFQGFIQVFFFLSLSSLFISPESLLNNNNNWLRHATKKITLPFLFLTVLQQSIIPGNIRMNEKRYAHIFTTHILYACEVLLLPLTTSTKCCVHLTQINCIPNEEWIHWQKDDNVNID